MFDNSLVASKFLLNASHGKLVERNEVIIIPIVAVVDVDFIVQMLTNSNLKKKSGPMSRLRNSSDHFSNVHA